MLDYARTFGLRTVVFRMSCIYGPHQFGTEDQGWVAHFLIQALKGKPITIYGDGRQVRDILFVEDLVNAFVLAQKNIDRLSGQAFNMGGGAGNTVSLLELLQLIESVSGRKPDAAFHDWRPSDQKYYVSDFAILKVDRMVAAAQCRRRCTPTVPVAGRKCYKAGRQPIKKESFSDSFHQSS
jgi:CDP-paratose 2-epimerase